MAEGVTVRVKVAGTYNDPDFRAIRPPSKAGDIITIAGGSHFDWLYKQGMVVLVTEKPTEEEALLSELSDLDTSLKAAEGGQSDEEAEPAEAGDVFSTDPAAPRPRDVVARRAVGGRKKTS